MSQDSKLTANVREHNPLACSFPMNPIATSSKIELFTSSSSEHSDKNEQLTHTICSSETQATNNGNALDQSTYTILGLEEELSESEDLDTINQDTQSEDSGSIANLTYQLEQVVDWIGNFQTEREHNSFRLSSKDSVIRELRLELFEKNKRLDEQAIELSKSQSTVKIVNKELVDAFEKLASNHYQQKEFKKAVYYYKKAIEKEQSTGNDSYKLASLFSQTANAHFELKQYCKARFSLNSALVHRPNSLLLLKSRVKAEFELGHYTWAKATAEDILRLDPKDIEVRKLLTHVQILMKKERSD